MKKRLLYTHPLGIVSLLGWVASTVLFRYYNHITAHLGYNGDYEFFLFASGMCGGAGLCALLVYVFRND